MQAGGAVDPGKPEDWMNSQVPPGHAKAYSGPNKFISSARIGRKVHTFVKHFCDFILPVPPKRGGGGFTLFMKLRKYYILEHGQGI